MSLPSLSVVTPSYNTLKYLKETVKSIHSQNYPNLQHIIMDGASTDGTVEYGQSLENVEFYSEKDRGQTHAINKAMAKCTGEIIGWLNSDDLYEAGTLKFIGEFFSENPDIDYIHSDINIINEESEYIGVSKASELSTQSILKANPIKQPTLFMRKRVIDTLGELDESLHYVMDMEYWLRLSMTDFKGYSLPDRRLSSFRIMEGTKTEANFESFIREWSEIITKFKSEGRFALDLSAQVDTAIQYLKGTAILAEMRSSNLKGFSKINKLWINALKEYPALMTNRGAWVFYFAKIFNIRLNRLKRFND